MVKTRWVTGLLVTALLLLGYGALSADVTQAATYPSRPINLIVPYAAGGSTDVLARAVAQVAPKYFPQPLVVVNRPGGGAIPGRVEVVQSAPDGYTLLFGYGSGEDLFVPHQRSVPYDVLTDLVPVARISIHSVVLVVPSSLPIYNLQEFVEWARSRQYVTAAVSTAGGVVDVTFRLFAKEAGFRVVPVPGTGGSDAMTRLVGGHADFGGGHPSEVLPHIRSGRVRPLAVALEVRDPAIDAPTFREQGYDVVTPGSVKGVAVPKGTPREIIDYLAEKFEQISRDPEFARIMADLGQPIMFQGPDEYREWFRQAYELSGQLVTEFASQ